MISIATLAGMPAILHVLYSCMHVYNQHNIIAQAMFLYTFAVASNQYTNTVFIGRGELHKLKLKLSYAIILLIQFYTEHIDRKALNVTI